ncbi:hypothetical protein HMPREF2604_07660 [Corynebacterium sp. HMSC055A01]|uniref:hypothetical protein n=1 Tax=Corynebacterium sp. HMSC055A01 TaxID=1715083 RepID=UPI0008A5308E|nr:hypothetical protein [Corynebacterium sp. HMSC055A01]OFN17808.1 hypothetical protein HMPREF2604_07660 [Corynebacterium sp. HMSC055A01]
MALRKISGRDTALITTGAPVNSWAEWQPPHPPWATLIRQNEGMVLPEGRWRLEVTAGRVLTYVNDKNVGRLTGVNALSGNVSLYDMEGNVTAFLTRLA